MYVCEIVNFICSILLKCKQVRVSSLQNDKQAEEQEEKLVLISHVAKFIFNAPAHWCIKYIHSKVRYAESNVCPYQSFLQQDNDVPQLWNTFLVHLKQFHCNVSALKIMGHGNPPQ